MNSIIGQYRSDNSTYIFQMLFNPDYVIGFLRPDKVRGDPCPVFTGSVTIARKSGCLEILAQHRYGEIEKSNEPAGFEAISARNRLSIIYFGFNQPRYNWLLGWTIILNANSKHIATPLSENNHYRFKIFEVETLNCQLGPFSK